MSTPVRQIVGSWKRQERLTRLSGGEGYV